jgi:hypothetical protein
MTPFRSHTFTTRYSSKFERRSQKMSEGFQYNLCERPVSPWGLDALLTESIGSEPIGLKPTEIGWAAGLLDGEACFRYVNGPQISVDALCRGTIEKLHKLFGGSCTVGNRRTESNRSVFRWNICGKDAARVSATVYDQLTEKKEQALILMKIMNYPKSSQTRKTLNNRLKKLKRRS